MPNNTSAPSPDNAAEAQNGKEHGASGSRDYTVPAVARALQLLECIGDHDSLTLQELVEATGAPKTSVYQILRTLTGTGYLRLSRNGGYSLGLKLFYLGNKASAQFDIRTEAAPLMYELMRKTQLTVFLAVLEGREGIYMAKVDGPYSVAIRAWVGKRLPLHSTSLGKALLAWKSPSEQRAILSPLNLTRQTIHTITDVEALLEHLAEVRRRGWAMDDEENVLAIRCVAAPIFSQEGEVVGAISISGDTQQFLPEHAPAHAEAVMEAARQLAARIGFPQSESSQSH